MLSTIPFNIYKISDAGHEPTESWYFNLLVKQEGTPKNLVIDLMHNKEIVKSVTYGEAYLANITDLRLFFSEPTALNINNMRLELHLETVDGEMVIPTRKNKCAYFPISG